MVLASCIQGDGLPKYLAIFADLERRGELCFVKDLKSRNKVTIAKSSRCERMLSAVAVFA